MHLAFGECDEVKRKGLEIMGWVRFSTVKNRSIWRNMPGPRLLTLLIELIYFFRKDLANDVQEEDQSS